MIESNLEKFREVVSEHSAFLPEKIEDGLTLEDDLAMSEVDLGEMADNLEEKFEITIPDEELDKWKTVKDVRESVELLMAAGE